MVFVCLFALCSNSFYAHADSGYKLNTNNYFIDKQTGALTSTVFVQTIDPSAPPIPNSFEVPISSVRNSNWYAVDHFELYKESKGVIAQKGQGYTFSISEIASRMYLYRVTYDAAASKYKTLYFKPHCAIKVIVQEYGFQNNLIEERELSTSETMRYLSSDAYMQYASSLRVSNESVKEDVHKIIVKVVYDYKTSFNASDKDFAYYDNATDLVSVGRLGLVHDKSQIELTLNPKTDGLLNSIIEIVNNIKNGIGNIFDTVKNGFSSIADSISNFVSTVVEGFGNVVDTLVDWFSNVVDTLIELPSKLWTLIENGLKALFIPDSYFIEDYKERYDELLAARFGAIYQSADILIDYFSTIVNFDKYPMNNIIFPETTIDVAGEEFTFGGWDINLIPHGFDFLADAVKFAIDVCVSLLFINGLRKRYDELVGGV